MIELQEQFRGDLHVADMGGWFNAYYLGKPLDHGKWFWDLVIEGATQKFLESARILTTKVAGERVQFTPLPGAIRVILYGSPYPEGLPGEEGKQTVH